MIIPSKYKLIIFDFDGTLVDTATDVIFCINQALALYDYPMQSTDKIKALLGNKIDSIISDLICEKTTEEELNKIVLSYKKIYNEYSKPNTKPFKEILTILNDLKLKGKKIAINSNKPQEILEPMANSIFPSNTFDLILGYNKGMPSKPNPYGVNMILNKLNISKEDSLYIGDGDNDYLTSLNSNIDFIKVEW